MSFDLRENVIKQTSYDAFGGDLEHYYAILAHLSNYFSESIIVEMGTYTGNSAAALSYNKSNKIYTFDVTPNEEAAELFKRDEYKNIKYIIGNCIENNWYGQPLGPALEKPSEPLKSEKEIFLSSELIFLDVDPHDGIQERHVLDFLITNNWKGIMICDDIGPQHLPMHEWWNSIDLPRYTIFNKYASGTGTGIICFDYQEVLYDVRIFLNEDFSYPYFSGFWRYAF